ncbi:hypothetical protein OG2516_08658 [Oceanicola granulosus HTCC2516]|uniref:DUF6473 domain-containing protein n=1 Tax=Oceanicola granulosus (strain ATCC BAA-861 / DSM 15982 / KCTC 12143 / HTCC2516) TaxID=314256 RepID=Q2CAW4_OCEGH|nr:DUF6473 family protein [Oceanicola granulosus]EAR49812.1 hypothetical protein OG2516_08658 [Oceanicola granulosus HTCC2516]
MRCDSIGRGRLDYDLCSYGISRLSFRGPRRALTGRYAAFVGGTETFGKFVRTPFPALLERGTEMTCVNFGCVNAGIGAFLQDTAVTAACYDSALTVIEVLGAHNVSNRLYQVHPRRNDRFLQPTPRLREVFDDIDFADFTFTRHMIAALAARSQERFAIVRDEIQLAWLRRMETFIAELPVPPVLLWLRPDAALAAAAPAPGPDPLFVTDEMMAQIAPKVAQVVRVDVSAQMRALGRAAMVVGPAEAAAAEGLHGPGVHAAAAKALTPLVSALAGGACAA